ncbi:MAG: molybdopterin synthase subunit MoaD [Candidatus Angelobacter sp.]|jgi:molybdopterin converting factor subunit 1|nr:molybdopterin synthase subunit MoaD [Candidatus Angelobacter sp.]
MQVRVIYFGMLKDAVGRQVDEVSLPESSTLADLLNERIGQAPVIDNFRSVLAFSVNQEYAQLRTVLHDGDEIAMLPPVSGGSESAVATPSRCSIVRDRINQQAIMDAIKRSEDGAISVFDGIVRGNTRGRKTLYLDYEAYEPMALKQMEQLAADAITNFKIREVAIVHRLGRLEIGETSVFIAVASAHRAAAMDASRWLIDSLKKTVPIWKKEYFHDGAVWADGEPFPEEIRAGSSGSTNQE